MYKWLVLKRKLESLVLFPFILLGRMIGLMKREEDVSIYFFFPFHHIGGAEKLHYQIAQAFTGKKAVIYFTRKSKGKSLLREFLNTGFVIRDISRYTDNKLLYPLNFIFRGIISAKINKAKGNCLVFNGQCNFAYKISPWINKKTPQVDLIHALNTFSKIRIPFLEFYTQSVTVSQEIIDKHKQLYHKYRVPMPILERFTFINYGIELPSRREKQVSSGRLNVLYVGRGSEEKRVYLLAKMAQLLRPKHALIQFNFVGDVGAYIPDDLKPFCNLLGAITNEDELDRIYRQNDVLAVTSSTESGPLVVLEAMARGLCILSTRVGIVNEHVHQGTNGFLFSSTENEEKIVAEGVTYLLELSRNETLLESMSQANLTYAFAHFGINQFREAYRSLFKSLNPHI